MKIDKTKIAYVEFDGVDMSDYPDFCDAMIVFAEWRDGTELTEDELDLLNDDRGYVYDKLMDKLF